MCRNDNCCTNHTCHAIMIFSILTLLLWPNAPNLNIFSPKNNQTKPQNPSIKGGHRNITSSCSTNPNNKGTMVMAFSYGVLFTLVLIFALNNFMSSPKHANMESPTPPTSTPRWSTTTTTILGSYDTSLNPVQADVSASAAGAGGIRNALLRTFPTFAYTARRPPRMGKGSNVCAICQSKFREDQMLRLLPYCDHLFHLDCIDEWLTYHSTCPCCRADL